MRFSTLCLLSITLLLVSGPAWTRADNDDNNEFNYDLSTVSLPNAAEFMTNYVDSSSPVLSQLHIRDDKKKCCECVKKVAHHVLNETFNYIEERCANATKKYEKKVCEWIESHKERYGGYLAVKLRPGLYSFGYCQGKGSCPVHPNKTFSELDLNLNNNNVQKYEFDFDVNPKQIVNDILLMERIAEAMQKDQSINEEDRQAVEEYEDEKMDKLVRKLKGVEGGKKKCKKCLRKGVKTVLKVMTFAIHRKCEHTKCPHLKKVCEWIGKHKECFRGMLYGHVEPWKFASGFCLGAKQCRHKKAKMDWGEDDEDDNQEYDDDDE